MLTVEQILDLAPNEVAKSDAKAYSRADRWYLAAKDGNMVWGIYTKPVKVIVAINTQTNKSDCTCKKENCRHILGLWLLCLSHANALISREAPSAVKKSISVSN